MIRPQSSYRKRAMVEFDNLICSHLALTSVSSTKEQAPAKRAGSLNDSVTGSLSARWTTAINDKVATPPTAPMMTKDRITNQDDRNASRSSLNVHSRY